MQIPVSAWRLKNYIISLFRIQCLQVKISDKDSLAFWKKVIGFESERKTVVSSAKDKTFSDVL